MASASQGLSTGLVPLGDCAKSVINWQQGLILDRKAAKRKKFYASCCYSESSRLDSYKGVYQSSFARQGSKLVPVISKSRSRLRSLGLDQVAFDGPRSFLSFDDEISETTCLRDDKIVDDEFVDRWLKLADTALEMRSVHFGKIDLHYLEESDEHVLSNRVLSLSRSNKVRSALELYASMEASGLQLNAHASNSLLACLLRAGSLDDALLIFEMMRKKDLATSHTYSMILKTVAESHGRDSAMKMFEVLEEDQSKMKFDVIVYNTMLSLCAKSRNWRDAEKFWRKLKVNSMYGTKLTYELLISTFTQCGQTELVLDAYYEMVQNHLEPNEDIMKAVISSCTKDGNWSVALNVFQKMVASGIKPNITIYNALINCLGKVGEEDLAFKIFEIMRTSGHTPDQYTWNALLSSLYRSGRYADALRLFESIKTQKSSEMNIHLYNMALLSCQRLGLWERSLQILWHMETDNMQISTATFNHVIRACEDARKPKVALQVYRHMLHCKCIPDTFTYLSLIRACIWGSLWTEVEEILESVSPDSSLYNALIHGFCLRGKTSLAKTLYEKMRKIGLQPDGKTRALMLQHMAGGRQQRHRRYICRSRP